VPTDVSQRWVADSDVLYESVYDYGMGTALGRDSEAGRATDLNAVRWTARTHMPRPVRAHMPMCGFNDSNYGMKVRDNGPIALVGRLLGIRQQGCAS
jgi:hypothetical protein